MDYRTSLWFATNCCFKHGWLYCKLVL